MAASYDRQHITFDPPPTLHPRSYSPPQNTDPQSSLRPSQHRVTRSHKTRRSHSRPLSFRWGIASLLTPNARFLATASKHQQHRHHQSQQGSMSLYSRRTAATPLLPIHEPAPAYLHTPTLYGETTISSPRSPNYSFRDLRSPQRADVSPSSSPHHPISHQHALATLLIHRGEQRHRRAWVHKRGNASTVMPLSPRYEEHEASSQSPTLAKRRKSVNNRIRFARFVVLGLALVGVLATCMSLPVSFRLNHCLSSSKRSMERTSLLTGGTQTSR